MDVGESHNVRGSPIKVKHAWDLAEKQIIQGNKQRRTAPSRSECLVCTTDTDALCSSLSSRLTTVLATVFEC